MLQGNQLVDRLRAERNQAKTDAESLRTDRASLALTGHALQKTAEEQVNALVRKPTPYPHPPHPVPDPNCLSL